jgi:hypothetical protein
MQIAASAKLRPLLEHALAPTRAERPRLEAFVYELSALAPA